MALLARKRPAAPGAVQTRAAPGRGHCRWARAAAARRSRRSTSRSGAQLWRTARWPSESDLQARPPHGHPRASSPTGVRIFPSLVRLLRHPNPHIRSKAVLLIGRGNQSAKWLRHAQPTPTRVSAPMPPNRCGASDTAEARELLQFPGPGLRTIASPATPSLGLYQLGDASMIAEIVAPRAATIRPCSAPLGRLGHGRNRRSAFHRGDRAA